MWEITMPKMWQAWHDNERKQFAASTKAQSATVCQQLFCTQQEDLIFLLTVILLLRHKGIWATYDKKISYNLFARHLQPVPAHVWLIYLSHSPAFSTLTKMKAGAIIRSAVRCTPTPRPAVTNKTYKWDLLERNDSTLTPDLVIPVHSSSQSIRSLQ